MSDYNELRRLVMDGSVPLSVGSLLVERNQLKAENEALRNNSDRYLFLRKEVSSRVQDFCIVKKYWGGTFPDRILVLDGADAEIDAALGKGDQP